jgi:ATP-binding cassette subfamily F protein 3
VNKEIEDGEREQAKRMAKPPAPLIGGSKAAPRAARRNEREVRKEISTIEKTIARLDEQKKQVNDQLMKSTDPAEAMRLHNEVTTISAQLSEAEERWCRLQEEIEAA